MLPISLSRTKLASKHRGAAQKLIAERRHADLAKLSVSASVPGVYTWLEGWPKAGEYRVPAGASVASKSTCWLTQSFLRAGQRARLAYNRASGSIPSASSSNPVLAHVGYDGWWQKVGPIAQGLWAA